MVAILKSSLRAIRRNILHSILTMLGIIVGISAVIVGVSMGAGAKAEVERQIAAMGKNLSSFRATCLAEASAEVSACSRPLPTGTMTPCAEK